MQHLIAKTGLGIVVNHVIQELELQPYRDSIKSMLIDVFTSKFEEFKRRHTPNFPASNLIAYYIVENEYPVGQNDMHQYFRCLANQVKISTASLSIGANEERKQFTIIEGYSRNETYKKRSVARAAPNKDMSWSKDKSKTGQFEPRAPKRLASKDIQEPLNKKRRVSTKKNK